MELNNAEIELILEDSLAEADLVLTGPEFNALLDILTRRYRGYVENMRATFGEVKGVMGYPADKGKQIEVKCTFLPTPSNMKLLYLMREQPVLISGINADIEGAIEAQKATQAELPLSDAEKEFFEEGAKLVEEMPDENPKPKPKKNKKPPKLLKKKGLPFFNGLLVGDSMTNLKDFEGFAPGTEFEVTEKTSSQVVVTTSGEDEMPLKQAVVDELFEKATAEDQE